jgi:D-lactate dehydrogenase
VTLDELLKSSDIISIHCPLAESTTHLINTDTISNMKNGVMLINTSRGAILDTKALIAGLKTGRIGYLGIDVYEYESDLFFSDLSTKELLFNYVGYSRR